MHTHLFLFSFIQKTGHEFARIPFDTLPHISHNAIKIDFPFPFWYLYVLSGILVAFRYFGAFRSLYAPHSHIVVFFMRWFKWFFDRVCKTNTHTFTERQHVCKKRSFYLKQNKMAKTHSCSNRIIHGHIYVHPQEIVRQIFVQIVSLRQITNIIIMFI